MFNLVGIKSFLKTPLARYIGFGLVLAVIVAILFVTRKPTPVVEKGADAVPATVAPLGFAKVTGDAEVRLTLPEAIKNYPALHTKLYNEGEATLNAFAAQAITDHAEAIKDGFDFNPYFYTINWNIAADSATLLSLYAFESSFSGGAHPNHGYQTLLWDKTKKDLIPTTALFIQGADFKSIDGFVCQQIATARSKRLEAPVTQAESGFDCPKLLESRLILVPSDQSGKIAAIDVLYGPYEVGSYAEGDYQVRLPASLLSGILNPEFSKLFGGTPSKTDGFVVDMPPQDVTQIASDSTSEE